MSTIFERPIMGRLAVKSDRVGLITTLLRNTAIIGKRTAGHVELTPELVAEAAILLEVTEAVCRVIAQVRKVEYWRGLQIVVAYVKGGAAGGLFAGECALIDVLALQRFRNVTVESDGVPMSIVEIPAWAKDASGKTISGLDLARAAANAILGTDLSVP